MNRHGHVQGSRSILAAEAEAPEAAEAEAFC